MTTTVRRADAGDAPTLHALAAVTFGLACPPGTAQSDIDEFVAANLSVDSFAGYLADPVRQLLIVEVDSAPAGYSMLVFAESGDPDVSGAITVRPSAELSKVYVIADAHGSGVGNSLMLASIEAAATRGSAGIWLGVNQENARANRFYERHGFHIVGVKRFLLGGRYEEDFVRELVLAPGAAA